MAGTAMLPPKPSREGPHHEASLSAFDGAAGRGREADQRPFAEGFVQEETRGCGRHGVQIAVDRAAVRAWLLRASLIVQARHTARHAPSIAGNPHSYRRARSPVTHAATTQQNMKCDGTAGEYIRRWCGCQPVGWVRLVLVALADLIIAARRTTPQPCHNLITKLQKYSRSKMKI